MLAIKPAEPLSGQSSVVLQPAPSENRISENASRAMIQDRKGYLWIGTIDGLNRYDGYRFHIYRPDPLDSTSISSNYIVDILEDRRGNIWVATFNGLNRYDWGCDCFVRFTDQSDGDRHLPGKILTDLLEDDRGRLWVSYYGGLSWWDHVADSLVHIPFQNPTNDGLMEWDVTGLATSHMGGIWIGYQHQGFSYFDDGRFIHYFEDEKRSVHLPLNASKLLERPDGRLWVGGGDGIVLFDPVDWELNKKFTGRCTGLTLIEPGRLWAGVNFDQVYEWHESLEAFRPLPVFYEGERVKGDLIIYLKDDAGRIWATHNGLAKQDTYEQRFRHVASEKGNPNSLSDPLVAGIELDQDGDLIVACNFGGVNYFDKESGRWRNHRNHALFDNELKEKRLNQGQALQPPWVWLISRGVLYRFNLESGVLARPFMHNMADVKWQNILKDKNNKKGLWLVGDGEVFRVSSAHSTPRRYSIPSEDDLKRLYQSERGLLLVASDTEIFRYDAERDTFVRYQRLDGPSHFDNQLVCLAMDRQDRLWVGRKSGLTLVTSSREEKHYTTADGLPNNNINAILFDGEGLLWLSTNNGLSRFDPETEIFRNFDKHDGLQDEIFLPNAAAQAADGTMYFGGVNGFNVFHPDSLPRDNPYPPKILISDLKIFNKSVRPGGNSVLRQHISDTKSIRLSYKQLSISFELTALGYSQPENNRYAYMIEGVDPDWNYVGNRHTASYNGLPRGETLLFKAKAANHDGVWTEEPAVLEIYINPPFWETPLFKVLAVLLFFGGLVALYQLRIYNIKLQNRRLEREVKKQTAEIEAQAVSLRTANEELQQQAATIRAQLRELNQLYETQSRFFTSLSHEFRTPLTLLLGNLDELVASEHPRQVLETFSRRMKLSARQLLLLVNQLMDAAKLESGQYVLRVGAGDFGREVQSMIAPFQPVMKRKALSLSCSETGKPPVESWFDRDIVHKVLNNLLSNALKHTEKDGEVAVLINYQPKASAQAKKAPHDGHGVEVTVRDTGKGIPAAQLPRIFDRFYQVDDPMSAKTKGTGIGLSLVKQLVSLHKGTIDVESDVGVGTVFRFSLPLSKQSYAEDERTPASNVAISTSPAPLPPEWYVTEKTFQKKRARKDAKNAPIILVVEDNAQIRALVARQLLDHYRVLEAEDGAQGWQMATRHLPDLIISDVIMPAMNGFEFCEKVKTDTRTSHIPVILLTALSNHQEKLRGLQNGADVYLSKPFSQEELLLRTENLLKHRERLRQRFIQESRPEFMPEEMNELDKAFLEKLVALIEQNLDNPELSVDTFTREMAVSRTQLFRKLKSLTGMSATEFIRDYRLRRAYQLLRQSDLNVSQVIYATGFNSRSYFYQCFKKKFGVSPSELLAKS